MARVTCSRCQKEFERNESDDITSLANAVGRDPGEQLCYTCALDKITGRCAPEEGDFNSARLISGEMTDDERRWLQEDLRAVESGCSIRESFDDTRWDEYDDPAWCYTCNRDTAFCMCICHECELVLEECECLCALCSTPAPGGGLCTSHASAWDETVQGPTPWRREDVGRCAACGIVYNAVYEVESHTHTRETILRRHQRKTCLRCS